MARTPKHYSITALPAAGGAMGSTLAGQPLRHGMQLRSRAEAAPNTTQQVCAPEGSQGREPLGAYSLVQQVRVGVRRRSSWESHLQCSACCCEPCSFTARPLPALPLGGCR